MRLELLWNPRLLCERLAIASQRWRRMGKLKNTPASGLALGHIDSLELLEILRDSQVASIYDIGANVGTWTLLAKAIIPGATIDAFEPLGAHLDGFQRNCAALQGVRLHPIALGPENTTMPLRVTSFSDASSMLPIAQGSVDLFGLTEVDSVPVPVRRLDDYLAEQGLPLPDLIKLDVQGFELAALSGGSAALTHAKALIVEVSFVELYKGQCMFAQVCSFLDAYGFGLHAFGATTALGKPIAQADVLFLRQ